MSQWALAVDRAHLRSVARLWRLAGLAVCEHDDAIWLRGEINDEELAPQFAAMPGARRFDVLADKQLRPVGRLVPEGHLPEGDWQPLAAWLKVALPQMTAGPTNVQIEPVRLRLVRSGKMREPALLETSLTRLGGYVESAPQWRIQRWQFAVAPSSDVNHRSVLVRGLPLPPFPGQVWTEEDGICVPAGYTWEPAVNAAVVRQLLGLAPQQIALLYPGGTHEVVLPEHWVRASRSAMRQMQEARQ